MDPAFLARLPMPHFEVGVHTPDLSRWMAGNTGIPGFTTFASGQDGAHVVLIALIHGNEIAGAILLDRMLRTGARPTSGRLTFGFANLAAFARFDPALPTASRFLDEDLNRVWDSAVLDGARRSSELDRAREMRPMIDTADVLLDLHSMLWPSEALILSGPSAKGRILAEAIGVPNLVVADRGHVTGPRLIDYARFTDPGHHAAACLVEAGQHWDHNTVETTGACVENLLAHLGMNPAGLDHGMVPPPRCAEVTMVITAATAAFSFLQPFRGGEVIAHRHTLIALDGSTEIRTPHDNCLLVMPSLRPSRGHTAVRLARFV